MSISRVRDFPDGAFGRDIILDKITLTKESAIVKRKVVWVLTAKGGVARIKPELFERISDYTRSHPTAPSAGRVFRKALNWPALTPDVYPEFAGQDPNWFFFLCVKTPDQRPQFAEWVDHVPFKVEFME